MGSARGRVGRLGLVARTVLFFMPLHNFLLPKSTGQVIQIVLGSVCARAETDPSPSDVDQLLLAVVGGLVLRVGVDVASVALVDLL